MKKTITNTQRADIACRSGARATVFEVRRDPILKNENILQDKSKESFPYINGATYKGQWNLNHKEGFGVQKNSDGTKYEGEWKQGKRHGRGTLWNKKGNKYVKQYAGLWGHDKMDGAGYYYYDSGEVYRGNWLKGKRSGHGIMEFPNGDVFEGEWYQDKRQGPGTYYVENGNVYEGYWQNDMKEGPGRFFYASTRKVYEGEWLEDSPKCGEFREPTQEEEGTFGESKIRRAAFNLPELTLENPCEILDCAIAQTRLNQSGQDALVRGNISKEDIEHAEHIFTQLTSRGFSTVKFNNLVHVFEALGVDLTADLYDSILEQIDLTDTTELSFPEVVDIASFILGDGEEQLE